MQTDSPWTDRPLLRPLRPFGRRRPHVGERRQQFIKSDGSLGPVKSLPCVAGGGGAMRFSTCHRGAKGLRWG